MRDPNIDRDTRWKFNGAINVDDVETVRQLLSEYPGFHGELSVSIHSGLHNAASNGSLKTAEFLIEEIGCDVNQPEASVGRFPIELAVGHSGIEMVKFLLDRGADPNVGRLLFSTIGKKDEAEELEMIKLLLAHGIDINQEFQWFDTDASFTPLEFAEMHDRPQIAKLLREHGAKERSPQPRPEPKTRSDEVVVHLEKQYGPVRPDALIEIVPTGMPISIHMIPPTEEHQRLTLFTTGMS